MVRLKLRNSTLPKISDDPPIAPAVLALQRQHGEPKLLRSYTTRWDINETFFIALNEAVVIYSDAPSVVSALKTFQAELAQKDRFEDNAVNLFRAMADHLGIIRKSLNDSFFLKPFTPQ